MNAFKKLIAGKYSLSTTFWAFGFGGNVVIGIISTVLINAGVLPAYSIIYALGIIFLCRLILDISVLLGITKILRDKITALGSIAFFIMLIAVVINIIVLFFTVKDLYL